MGGKKVLGVWVACAVHSHALAAAYSLTAMSSQRFSSYFFALEDEAKSRYLEKLAIIGPDVDDPYVIDSAATSDAWPSIEFPDVYNYLINTPSLYTKESLKAYKSLDGYKFFTAGWVTDVRVAKPSKYVVLGKVGHSQAVNAPYLRTWVGAEENGTVLCAHCTCMAGLGEACSHVAALLFAAIYTAERANNASCTSVPCRWADLSGKAAPFAPTAEIDFVPPKKKMNLSASSADAGSSSSSSATAPRTKAVACSAPTNDELESFYENLSKCGQGKSVILSLQPNYWDAFLETDQPMILTDLYDDSLATLSYSEILEASEDVFSKIVVSESQSRTIEEQTKGQARSRLWFRHRAGRVTASNFKAAARTDSESGRPSISLIKRICYPESYKFFSEATSWGSSKEATALQAYEKVRKREHRNLRLKPCGLIVRPQFPQLGATPDSLVCCDCCGEGVVEVKCPVRCKEQSLTEAARQPDFCLKGSDGLFALARDHAYYYQIQLQMLLSSSEYCDFVVWTPSCFFVERVVIDNDFLSRELLKVKLFYRCGILPEENSLGRQSFRRIAAIHRSRLSVPSGGNR